ncbi:MAG TPA: ABC transporter ATP-binding protein, partial [Acidimicrobiales bacterium]|nr:ABC transporter ATP-binding protein [Acidimicrobiales bacterium]
MTDQPLLMAKDISKSFGGVQALAEMSILLDHGESVGLVGPNGAGKTTLFNCLLGVTKPDTGVVVFDGTDISNYPIYRRAKLGIARTFQRMELFTSMTVREHLVVASRSRSGDGRLWKDLLGLGRPSRAELGRVDAMLDLLELADVSAAPVDTLSMGRGRLVELGRALMSEPKLLLLDEPSSGLDSNETDSLVDTLISLRDARNLTVLVVEHDLEMVTELADRTYVLDFGHLIAQGPTEQVLSSDAVRHAYLGKQVTDEVASAGSGGSGGS